MDYLSIENWDKWQSYRQDRGQPPWIKVHRRLLRSVRWTELTDSQRGQLVSMWMLAADKNGRIPDNPAFIKRVCSLSATPDLQVFVDMGFMSRDAQTASNPGMVPPSMTPQSRVEEIRVEGDDAKIVLDYLNQVTGRSLTVTRDIEACFKREKCTVKECKMVIDHKWAEWGDGQLRGRVNHTTPWIAKHFQNYLDEAKERSRQQAPRRGPLSEKMQIISDMSKED